MINWKISWREMDFAVFCILFVFLISYQIQNLFPQFSTMYLREVLYAYLYARILFFYNYKFTPFSLLMGGFILVSILTALNTNFQFPAYGWELPIRGFKRFLNVALLAPLAAVFIRENKQLKVVMVLWCAIVFVGFSTVLYQLAGGNMDWLVQNYIAIRANLIRYKSFLGEPNVSGMSAVLLLVIAFWGVQNKVLRWIVIGVAYFGGLMSLSKGALMGCLIVCGFVVLHDSFDFRQEKLGLPSRRVRENFLVLGLWVVAFLFIAPLFQYAVVHLQAALGQVDSPSVIQDLNDRAYSMKYGGDFGYVGNVVDVGAANEWLKKISVLLGQSFGRAGSVAIEMNIPYAVGPHNSYLEIFIVGGVVMLGLFLALQWLTLKKLFAKTKAGDPMAKILLLLFVVLSIFMLGYPNIYEPVTGSVFWLLVGIGAREEYASANSVTECAKAA